LHHAKIVVAASQRVLKLNCIINCKKLLKGIFNSIRDHDWLIARQEWCDQASVELNMAEKENIANN